GYDLKFPGSFHHQLHLLECTCQGLLHVHMLSFTHGKHGDGKVGMIGNSHANRIDFLSHLIEHSPEVLETRDIGKHFKDFFRMRRSHIHIAQGNYVTHPGMLQGTDDLAAAVSYPAAGQVYTVRSVIKL